MARKGNRNQENPKLRSGDMSALMVIDKKARTENDLSPEVNKRNLKAMANAEKAEAVANNLLNLAGVIDSEIGNLDKKCLKNATAVDLDDVRAVMERSRDYFIACATAKNPPSMLTYCSIGLGLTQNRVNDYIRKHNNDSTEFILRVKDLIADQITTGAMYGNLDNIMAIFQLKNLHGFADNVRIEAAVAEQAPQIDESALKAEYEAYAKANGIELPKEVANG
jgi:hypothetical protein